MTQEHDGHPLGIRPGKLYSTAECVDLGYFSSAVAAGVYRSRTKTTGRQVGPRWVALGRRILYPGAELLAAMAGPAAEAAREVAREAALGAVPEARGWRPEPEAEPEPEPLAAAGGAA